MLSNFPISVWFMSLSSLKSLSLSYLYILSPHFYLITVQNWGIDISTILGYYVVSTILGWLYEKRVSIVLDEKLLELVDKYSIIMHISRSATISMFCSILINEDFVDEYFEQA